MQASDRVTLQGRSIDLLTRERFKAVNRLVKSKRYGGEKSDITVIQAIGGAPASGGTHIAPGGSLDISEYNHKNRNKADRILGGAGWWRPYIRDLWMGHYHTVTAGAGYAPASARRQVTAMYADHNGLRNNGRDTGFRPHKWSLFVAPWTDRGKIGVYYAKSGLSYYDEPTNASKKLGSLPKGGKFTVIAIVNTGGTLYAVNVDGKCAPKSGLTMTKAKAKAKAKPKPKPEPKAPPHLRVGTFNFPDDSKITNASETDRIKRAVEQIKPNNLHVVALQELVGRKGPATPSALGAKLRDAMGGKWVLVTPTTDFNENYFLLDSAAVTLRDEHPDTVIRGALKGNALGGRHLSAITVKTAGDDFTIGNTHLIDNNRPGAEVQAGLVAEALSRLADGRKAVLLGDLNTSGPLSGLTKRGFRNARVTSKSTPTRNASTYINQEALRPENDPDWIVDQGWVSEQVAVHGYNVVQDLTSSGAFKQPRSSDHSLTIFSLS